MALISRRSTIISDHLNRSTVRRHSGIHTVTPAMREAKATDEPKRESPFGKMVYGPEAGARPTAYKPIFPVY